MREERMTKITTARVWDLKVLCAKPYNPAISRQFM